MTIRSIRAVSLVLFVGSAQILAGAPADSPSTPDASRPVNVKVETIEVIDAGTIKDEPRGRFGIVNLKSGTCYAFAPPGGPTVEVGQSYMVIPASDIDADVRAKLTAGYPTCATVDVVGRAVH